MRVTPSREAARLGEAWRLALRPPPTSGASGGLKGRGAGASTEFLDHRHYRPGDDVRKLDWRAYARTDQLLLKQFQEEVRPTLELVVDCSASMATDPTKAALAMDLTSVLAQGCKGDGWLVRTWLLGDAAERPPVDGVMAEGIAVVGRRPLQELAHEIQGRLQPGAVVVVLSDFLTPHQAPALVRGLSRRAGVLGMIQVLSDWDASPPEGGSMQLEDAETGESVEVVLDAATVRRYRDRLGRLQEGLSGEVRRVGGRFVVVQSGQGLDRACRQLAQEGILAVAN